MYKKLRRFAASVIAGLLVFVMCFGLPCAVFAADGDSPAVTDRPVAQRLLNRNAMFAYGYTECTGDVHPVSTDAVDYYISYGDGNTGHFAVTMMLCDSDHVVQLDGLGITEDNVTFTFTNPHVLEVDSAGNVTLNGTGTAEITASVRPDNEYKACTLYLEVTVDKHESLLDPAGVHYEGRTPQNGLDLVTTDGAQRLVVPHRPGANVSIASISPQYLLYLNEDGMLVPVAPGNARLTFIVDDGGGRYKKCSVTKNIKITGKDLRSSQEITGKLGPFTVDWHDGLALDLHAKTKLVYTIVDSNGGVASVDENGFVSFHKPGSICIKVTAVQTSSYKSASKYIYITARDYAAEEAAALKLAIKRAKNLKAPKVKVKALKGGKVKISWSKVSYASGYIVYVKYPGEKKYVKATSRKATVKSVTHKGLSRKRVYCYKVRAYKKVNGKRYYGPLSKAKKVRVR